MGTLYMEADLGEVRQSFRLFLLIGAGFMVVCCSVAYVISSRLQTLISGPVLALAATAQRVSERRDYSVRAAESEGFVPGLAAGSATSALP